eukprot:TRINITY_DN3085_c0_g1_i4.p2 TRINITY_DN3085_c0_g1~~TRINITY_DN3085_c0_g1_i4.p2  ORF type:complete len:166 (+),score=55.82 TRINITY_DN3085_c0_g1_i4:84-581(+)
MYPKVPQIVGACTLQYYISLTHLISSVWLHPQMMRRASKLRHLDLSHCAIGVMGVDCIADAAASHPALQMLDLADNEVRESGGLALTKAIFNARRLARLDLSFNCITQACVDEWAAHGRHSDSPKALPAPMGRELLVELRGNPRVEAASLPHLSRNGLSLRFAAR